MLDDGRRLDDREVAVLQGRNLPTGHSAVCSAKTDSPSSNRNSNSVSFSYSAINAFWQQDEKGGRQSFMGGSLAGVCGDVLGVPID